MGDSPMGIAQRNGLVCWSDGCRSAVAHGGASDVVPGRTSKPFQYSKGDERAYRRPITEFSWLGTWGPFDQAVSSVAQVGSCAWRAVFFYWLGVHIDEGLSSPI